MHCSTLLCLAIIVILKLGLTMGAAGLWLPKVPKKRNVILMISDGFGPASETFARSVTNFLAERPNSNNNNDSSWDKSHHDILMELDAILVGSSRTRSSSSLITDSAAGATAFSCAKKSYNRAIGVDPKKNACGTVLEAAKEMGYKTGLIVTSRITHATPAAFSAHVDDRDMEDVIAKHQAGILTDDFDVSTGNSTFLGKGPLADVMLGGGRAFYLPSSHPGSVRRDDLDLIRIMKEKHGYAILETGADLARFRADKPVLGLFALDHCPYMIDTSGDDVPSLLDMTRKGLETLERLCEADPKCPGFFAMIEGSRIDMAAHTNDPASHYGEIIEYQRTVKYVKDFVSQRSSTSTLISVSDHETGGLSLGCQLDPAIYPEPYQWHPEPLTRQRRSIEFLTRSIVSNPVKYRNASCLISDIIQHGLGIPLKESDLSEFYELAKRVQSSNAMAIQAHLADMISRRCLIGWSSHGHSGVDVNLYAHGKDSHLLRGSRENTEIGDFIVNALDLDLDGVTGLLGTKKKSINELSPNEFNVLHYH